MPYIHHGYRVTRNSYETVLSIFTANNESFNILSHLGGMIVFFFYAFHDVSGAPTIWDGLAVGAFDVLATFTMGASAGYHLMLCDNDDKRAGRWASLDFLGISLALCGGYVAPVYYAFYCHPALQVAYMAMIIALTLISVAMQLFEWFGRRTFLRVTIYAFLLFAGVLPLIHIQSIEREDAVRSYYVWSVACVYACMIVATGFYISRVPERIFPGEFDYYGSSHNFWHMFVLAALFFWRRNGLRLASWRGQQECPVD